MPYPQEIIEELTQKYGLSGSLQQQLCASLDVKEVRQALEKGQLYPEHLLLLVRESEKELYISVLWPLSAKAIVDNLNTPIFFEELQEIIQKNIAGLKEWDAIKTAILDIELLPRSKNRMKQTATRELYPRLAACLANHAITLGMHPLFREEFRVIPALLAQYMNALVEPIQEASKQYFEQLYQKMGRVIIEITFSPKRDGTQLGTAVNLTYVDENTQIHTIQYHVKTHQQGATSTRSTTNPPDPKELFIYKVLENIGCGPKTHFFFNPSSSGGFFIATQDVAFTKVIEKTKRFLLFDANKVSYNSAIEESKYDVARKAIIQIDMIGRIFELSDVTTNPGNFGCVEVLGKTSKWKILDFRAPLSRDFYENPVIFSSFLKGNGLFNYEYAEFMRDIFVNPEKKNRKIIMAQQIILELKEGRLCHGDESRKMPLKDAIQTANQEVARYVEQHHREMNIKRLEESLEDLANYSAAVIRNFESLSKGVNLAYLDTLEAEARAINSLNGC